MSNASVLDGARGLPLIHGIGTDIVKIGRISASLERFGERLAQRVLAPMEWEAYRASRRPDRFLAKRFAAKEAVAKAFGLGFRDGLALGLIGVVHDVHGKPGIVYSGRAVDLVAEYGITESLISLSDEQDYAVAFAVLLRG